MRALIVKVILGKLRGVYATLAAECRCFGTLRRHTCCFTPKDRAKAFGCSVALQSQAALTLLISHWLHLRCSPSVDGDEPG